MTGKTFIASLAIIGAAGVAMAAFTDVSVYQGKSDVQRLTAALAGNFDAIESGVGAGATAVALTNGQAVTVGAGVYIVSGVGGANDTTNTITLAAPTAAGQKVTLIIATASTNLIAIADSGTVASSGALLLDANDTAVLQAVDASTWCLISKSDN
jgi:hypothetical protein